MRWFALSTLFGLASATKYGYNHVPFLKDSDAVEAAFSDVDIELLSPAFLDTGNRQPGFANGTQGATSHEVVDTFLRDLADRNHYMTYHTAEFTSEENRPIPYIHLKNGNSCSIGGSSKVRVWIQSGVHGNEPAGDEASQALLGLFDADPEWAKSILDHVELLVLPRYSPDNQVYFQRVFASNFDPNRDHTKLGREHTRNMKALFASFDPHVTVDMHEYLAISKFGEDQYLQAADGLFSAAKNLNIHKDIRALSEELFAKEIVNAMEEANLRAEPYVTGGSSDSPDFIADFTEADSDAKIGRNGMALMSQGVVFLTETRGIGLANMEFQRRTAAGLTMLKAIVQTAADNAEQVRKTIEVAREDFIQSSDDIVITDYTETSIRPWPMVHPNGSVVNMPVQFASTTPTIANLTRARPEAYLIPVAWPDLAERLRVAGLEVETLSEPWSGSVEVLTIESTKIDSSYFEGAIRVTATTSTEERELELPAGSFLVSTRQRNAAIAFTSLEPENIDSLVSFNIIPLGKGDEYPVFRVM